MAADLMAQAMFPNLTRNETALRSLGQTLSPEEQANLQTVTGINAAKPEDSGMPNLMRMETLLARNPNALPNMQKFFAVTPPQARAQLLKDAAANRDFSLVERVAHGDFPAPGATPPSPTAGAQPPKPVQAAAQPTPPQPPQPAQANPAQPAATQPPAQPTTQPPAEVAAATPPAAQATQGDPAAQPTAANPATSDPAASGAQAQGANPLAQMIQNNPQLSGLMSRMTEMMQGLMGRLLTGFIGFLGKIFGGMDGSGGSLFAASSNPQSNNLGNALALGGADQNQRVSVQVGDEAPQDTTVGALQQRKPDPRATPSSPAFDPANRMALNGPQFQPGMA